MNDIDTLSSESADRTAKVKINLCRQCRQKIEPSAKVCHHCGSHQNQLLQIVRIVPLVMVALTVVQLFLASMERIESSRILDEVNEIKQQAVGMLSDVEQTKHDATGILSMVEEREKRISERLVDVKQQTISIEQRLLNAETEFKDQQNRMSERISKVAYNAEIMIEESTKKVNVQVENSNNKLKNIEASFHNEKDELTANLRKLRDDLSVELEKLKWRDKLMTLRDNSIANGDRDSYNEILSIYNKNHDNDRGPIVRSHINQIKSFYLRLNRYKNRNFYENGTVLKVENLSTFELISTLKNNPNEVSRYLAARELKNRNEVGVPEALIESIKGDRNLDVVAYCIKSYEAIANYDLPDVLDAEQVENHWQINKDEIRKKLKSPSSSIQETTD